MQKSLQLFLSFFVASAMSSLSVLVSVSKRQRPVKGVAVIDVLVIVVEDVVVKVVVDVAETESAHKIGLKLQINKREGNGVHRATRTVKYLGTC